MIRINKKNKLALSLVGVRGNLGRNVNLHESLSDVVGPEHLQHQQSHQHEPHPPVRQHQHISLHLGQTGIHHIGSHEASVDATGWEDDKPANDPAAHGENIDDLEENLRIIFVILSLVNSLPCILWR